MQNIKERVLKIRVLHWSTLLYIQEQVALVQPSTSDVFLLMSNAYSEKWTIGKALLHSVEWHVICSSQPYHIIHIRHQE